MDAVYTAAVLAHRITVHADSTVCVAVGVKSLVVRISMHAVKLVAYCRACSAIAAFEQCAEADLTGCGVA